MVSFAAIGPPGFGQALPQLFVSGQVMKRLAGSPNKIGPPGGRTNTFGTALVSVIEVRQAFGLRMQIGPRLPKQARVGCGLKSAARQMEAARALKIYLISCVSYWNSHGKGCRKMKTVLRVPPFLVPEIITVAGDTCLLGECLDDPRLGEHQCSAEC